MRLCFFIFLLLLGPAASPLAAASVRSLAFDLPATDVVFEIDPAEGTTAAAAEGKPKLRFEVRKNQFSEPFHLMPGRHVARCKDFKSTVSFTLPDTEGGRFLLLVLPRLDGGCSILPIPDDIGRIGPGDRFLLNATGEEIAVRFGSQRENIKPGHSVYLRPPRPAPKDRRIEVEMVRRVGGIWTPFNSTYWPLDPTARSFVLVHPDPVTGTPRVRNLAEVP